MNQRELQYIPPLGWHWLTPFYDSLARPFGAALRRELLRQMAVQPGQQVLDLGCGTGIMAIALQRSVPGAVVAGLDADERALTIAQVEAERVGVEIQWDRGLAYQLPYPDNSLDLVMSSFMIHHLTTAHKERTFREVWRVLRPDGNLYILDFGPPFSPLTRTQTAVMKHLEQTADNYSGRILPMLAEAGFASARGAGHGTTLFGPVFIYVAHKSGA